MNKFLSIVALISVLLIPKAVLAGKVVIEAVEDAYVSSLNPDANYGTSTVLKIKTDFNFPPQPNDEERTLVKFDLSTIPPYANINAAYLYMSDPSTGIDYDVSIYKVNGAWVEDHVTWNNQPSYDTTSLDRIPWYPSAGWYYGDVTTAVQQWHAGTVLNNGLVLMKMNVGAAPGSREFDSRETFAVPKLMVIYDCESTEVSPDVDTYVSIDDTTATYYTSTALHVQTRGRWSYLQFDPSGLPADAEIEFARLRMYHYQGVPNYTGFSVGPCRVLEAWPDSMCWNNKPDDTGTPESIKGPVGIYFYTGWVDMDITELFDHWRSGVHPNYGLVVKYPLDDGQSTSTRYGAFRSSEYATAAYRPRVEVFYTVPPPNEFVAKQSLTGVHQADAAWGDFDGDDDLDLVVCGESASGSVTITYENQDGTLVVRSNPLPGITSPATGCLAWGDVDNDGDLDLAMSGQSSSGLISHIYVNDGLGNLTLGQSLPGRYYSSLAWGDVDNDGDLDLFLQGNNGSQPVAQVYNNDPLGTLSAGQTLDKRYYGCADWADWDNDGDLDLLATGSNYSNRRTIFYQNTGGVLDSISLAPLPNVTYCDVAWGDYDNDGDMDLAFTGQTIDAQSYVRIYNNVTELDTLVKVWERPSGGLHVSSCAWGDFDNDGYLDVAFAGFQSTGVYATEIYYNESGMTFALHPRTVDVPDIYYGSVSWADVDSDGDLDFFVAGRDTAGVRHATLFDNTLGVPNNRPSPPTVFNTIRHPSPDPPHENTLYLRWGGASDAETPERGLYYCVQVGTTINGDDVFSGTYGSPLMGNVGQAYELAIPAPDTLAHYYWRVKSIDTGLMASEWSFRQCSWNPDDSLWTDRVYPIDDAYVNDGQPDIALGTSDNQRVVVGDLGGGNAGADICRSYYKFDLGGAVVDSGKVESAQLYVRCWDVNSATPFRVGVWGEVDDVWSEGSIMWNFAPQDFDSWPSDVVTVTPGAWIVWDVTDIIAGTADSMVTMVLMEVDPPERTDGPWAEFYSTEYGDGPDWPYLKITYSTVVGVDDETTPQPRQFALGQNVPNPFNPQTRLRYTIPDGSPGSPVVLRIYDVAGRLVRTLVDEPQPAGTYTVYWNGTSQSGGSVASGVYFYQLRWNGRAESRKMLLLR